MSDEKNRYTLMMFVHPVYYPPVTDPVTEAPRERTMQWFYIWMVIRISHQPVKTTIEAANQRLFSVFVKILCFSGEY